MWLTDIPWIKNGETPLSAEGLNAPLQVFEARTDYLYNELSNCTTKSGIIVSDIGFSSTCERGMLIAYDSNTGSYIPAAAVWSAVAESDGNMCPATSAYVIGLLLTDVATDNSASILLYGNLADISVLNIVAPNQRTGLYYLGTNGAAVHFSEKPALAVPVFYVLPSGKLFLNPQAPERGTHYHNFVELNPLKWLSANSPVFSLLDKPENASYGYDLTDDDTGAYNVFESCKYTYKITLNGIDQLKSSYILQDGTLWLLNQQIDDAIHVTFYGIAPYLGNDPYIHAVITAPNNKLLNLNNNGGLISINIKDKPTHDVTGTGKCIQQVTQATGMITAPVINCLYAGDGIRLSSYSRNGVTIPGHLIIQTSAALGTLLDCSIVNANGVLIGGDSNSITTKFPKNRRSSISGYIRIPGDNIECLNGRFVIWLKGMTASLTNIYLDLTVQEAPTVTSIPPAASKTTYALSAETSTTDSNRVFLAHSAVIGFKPNALITITLTADLTNSPTDINAVCFGIQLE